MGAIAAHPRRPACCERRGMSALIIIALLALCIAVIAWGIRHERRTWRCEHGNPGCTWDKPCEECWWERI